MARTVSKDRTSSSGPKNPDLRRASRPFRQLTDRNKSRQIWQELAEVEGIEFMESFQQSHGIEIGVGGKGWNQIPSKGAFITVSNHQYELWDCVALLKALIEKRPDVKLMLDFLPEQLYPLRDFVLLNPSINPHNGVKDKKKGKEEAFQHLRAGKPLVLFPSGKVSSLHQWGNSDLTWQSSIIKLIRNAEVPVIPVYLEGSNRLFSQFLGLVPPHLRTSPLLSETLKRKSASIQLQVGNPISVRELQDIREIQRLKRYLRARTYALSSERRSSSFFRFSIGRAAKAHPLAAAYDSARLEEDIRQLGPSDLIKQQQEYDLYFVGAEQIPNILQEIGRLRELTFRSVGEGSLYERDLDEFDLHYRHLFLWDREAKKIAGAYRIGLGDEIISCYGKKGFYTHRLFKMKSDFEKILGQGLELGRSFVVPEYQRKRLPLFMLWAGLHEIATHHSQYRYLFGPVSISNEYSRLSRELIVAMIRQFFWDEDLAKLVKARKQFRPSLKHVCVEDLLDGTGNDLSKLDRLIEELEPQHSRLPVLLKKYIKQKARIISFNVDPKFCNALDGLIIMDLADLPQETHQMMKGGK